MHRVIASRTGAHADEIPDLEKKTGEEKSTGELPDLDRGRGRLTRRGSGPASEAAAGGEVRRGEGGDRRPQATAG